MQLQAFSKIPEATSSISLNDIPTGRSNLNAVRKQLLAPLGDDIFNYHTFPELLFQLFKRIDPIKENLTSDAESIEKACGLVIQHFLNTKKRLVATMIVDGVARKSEPTNDTSFFCEVILGLGEAPGPIYAALLRDVQQDLRSVSNLIKNY